MKTLRQLLIILAISIPTISYADEWDDECWQDCLCGHYLTAKLGLTSLSDSTAHTPTTSSETAYDWGYFASVGWGYLLQDCLSIEAEVLRQSGDVDSVIINGAGMPSTSGRQKVWGFMLNGIYTNPHQIGCFHPYLGFGIGLVHFNIRTGGTGGNDIDDTHNTLGVQTITGLCYPWNACVDLCLEYRYLITGDPRFRNRSGQGVTGEFSSHSFSGGIRYHF